MRWLAVLVWFWLPISLSACPMCRETVTQTTASEEDDQTREAVGYNRSIYFMLAMPMASLGVLGFCVYRSRSRR